MRNPQGEQFEAALASRAAEIADACTQCGKCFDVCPMPEPGGIGGASGAEVVGGIVDLLRGGPGTHEAVRWAEICSRSGYCIEACDYGVNPRVMMSLAKMAALAAARDGAALNRLGKRSFANMARGVRVLSRLQLSPSVLERLNPGLRRRDRPTDPPPEVVFYTGCNVLKTPHIALLAMHVLDLLEIRYEVMGGPSHCCGIFQFIEGDVAGSGRKGLGSIDLLASAGTQEVLSWCPSCQLQFGELGLPAYEATTGSRPFNLVPYLEYVDRHLDRLRPYLVHRVEKRVALHERPALPSINASVRRILAAVPGLEIVELDVPRVGYMSVGLNPVPEFKAALRDQELDAASAAGVDVLATVFHACHREICHYEDGRPYEIVNFMELVGESLGVAVPDLYKQYRRMRDIDAAIEACADLMGANGLELDTVREALQREFA